MLSTCNIHAIKNKELQVSELIHDHAIDILLAIETWLTAKDDQWKKNTDLNKVNLQLHTKDRKQGKGGGLALICKQTMQVHHIPYKKCNTFEHPVWEITSGNTALTIHGIYHPPYSLRNKCTNNMFLDKFTEFLTELSWTVKPHLLRRLQLTCKWWSRRDRTSNLHRYYWSSRSLPTCRFWHT